MITETAGKSPEIILIKKALYWEQILQGIRPGSTTKKIIRKISGLPQAFLEVILKRTN